MDEEQTQGSVHGGDKSQGQEDWPVIIWRQDWTRGPTELPTTFRTMAGAVSAVVTTTSSARWRQASPDTQNTLNYSVADLEWFIPDSDPALNFRSSGSGSNLY